MSNFAALMALSATQTREAQDAVTHALDQRKAAETARRKQQEETDRREKALAEKMLKRHFEKEKEEQERRRREEAEKEKREREKERREAEQRDALRYGPGGRRAHGGSKWPSSSSGAREEVRRRRLPDEDEDDSAGGLALTREELRQRKRELELRRSYGSSKRSPHNGYGKAGRRLPGGAVDIATPSTSQSSSTPQGGGSAQSVRARLSAAPNTLTKLNVVKRDTRTIDEILRDRARARDNKVLDGEEAQHFHDWFGGGGATPGKKGEREPLRKEASMSSAPVSRSLSPVSRASSTKATTPVPSSSAPAASAVKKSASAKPMSSSSPAAAKRSISLAPSSNKYDASGSKKSVPRINGATTSKASINGKSDTCLSRPASLSRANTASKQTTSSYSRKRPRSPSFSPSPPPVSKRRSPPGGGAHSAVSQEIWKLFGKDRSAYVARDVLSDDEDMEAGASDLEREEWRSSRLAKKEDEVAMEEERRHEEEKRRRKKERERRGY